MHEAQLHGSDNCFVTLTYDEAHLPAGGSLTYRHFQLFCKKLRNAGYKFRFFMCGEYGDQFKRPHYHACMFGYRPTDLQLFSEARGHRLYTSESLAAHWGRGFVSIGELTQESAAYTARYCLKKITGPEADEYYQHVDQFGEIHNVEPEFAHMSRRPGIGADWFAKYLTDVYPRDGVIMNGRKYKPPRFYDALLEKVLPDEREFLDLVRYQKSNNIGDDCSPERLCVRERVVKARVSFLKREVE